MQPDGRSLIDANLIRPGWQLILPAERVRPGRADDADSRPARRAGRDSVVTGRPLPNRVRLRELGHQLDVPASPPGPVLAATPAGNSAASVPVVRSGSSSTADPSLIQLAAGGALLIAGPLAVSTRRGPYAEPSDDEGRVLAGGDPALAEMLDRELRRLAFARTAQGRELPQPLIARVSAEQITLEMVGGDMSAPPAPWSADASGRVWALPVTDSAEPVPDVAHRSPAW